MALLVMPNAKKVLWQLRSLKQTLAKSYQQLLYRHRRMSERSCKSFPDREATGLEVLDQQERKMVYWIMQWRA